MRSCLPTTTSAIAVRPAKARLAAKRMRFNSIVVLTGAGLSAESGLGTFRDKGGLWSQFNIAEVATPKGFARNPTRVHDFYNLRRRRHDDAEPNAAHYALARLEQEHRGEVLTVTQNIDALHEAAGTKNLIHMHGELGRALCAQCGLSLPWVGDLRPRRAAPPVAKTAMRPDVVWFGEMPREMDRIYDALGAATSSSRSGRAAPSTQQPASWRRRGPRARILSSSISSPRMAPAISPRRSMDTRPKSSRLMSSDCCRASAQDARRPRCAARTGTGRRARRA